MKKSYTINLKKMSYVKSVIGTCIFALILTEVTPWTIDLPEVRKYFFERNERRHGNENKIYFSQRPELVNYNNIEGDSLHNSPERGVNGGRFEGNGIYADDYGYYNYMEKKVHGALAKGSAYLEGLRQAVEQYSRRLQNCTTLDRSRPQTNRTWVPESASPEPLSPQEASRLSCEQASRQSEHARRLASLVTWAIRELQDIAYAKDFDKDTKQSEEDELLLQLAWALDQLARLTGFEPDPRPFATQPTPAPEPSTTPLTYFNLPVPNDGPTAAGCIKDAARAGVPATVRCATPVPVAVLQFLNLTDAPLNATAGAARGPDMQRLLDMFNNSGAGGGRQAFADMSPGEVRARMRGCLAEASDEDTCFAFQAFLQFLNTNFPQLQQPENWQVRPNRETDSSQLEILQESAQNTVVPLRKTRKLVKRSVSGPLKDFAAYYGKYKAWTNSNPTTENKSGGKTDSFDVDNHLSVKTVQKRSIVKDGVAVRIPEDPMQDISDYVKQRPGVHYDRNTVQAEKIKAYMEKILQGSGMTAKQNVRKLEKLIKSVQKRSIYERKLQRPRVPEDPMQDISYYVKRKAGTNIRPNMAHAARVRLGLEEVFQRGDLATVRRYGSNYVPGVRPLNAGAVESFTDF